MNQNHSTIERNLTMPSERLNTFNDESGLVTVSVFRYQAPSLQQHFFDLAAEVAEDMVAIGGGGIAVEFPYGALLTASYPNGNLSAWLVSSKDHGDNQPHYLTAYAIGLKIEGMTREQLLDAIFINWQESGLGQHPQATATMPGEFRLVSGGFKIDWSGEGNLATASFPSNDLSWTAKSKDHGSASPANLHVCAIGLRENLPVGQVEVAIDYQESVTSQHPSSVADMTDGFALTGGGAEAHWRTHGSLLWRLEPATQTSNQDFAAGSKDHRAAENCTITAYALGIKIHPL
jgi:hypothetical protein